MDEFYQDNILEHFKHPHHKGVLDEYTIKAEGSNPSCGDELVMYLSIKNGVISDASFEGVGCAISTASSSMLLDAVISKKTEDVREMNDQDVYQLLGIPIGPQREKCALLSLRTLQNAINEAKLKGI